MNIPVDNTILGMNSVPARVAVFDVETTGVDVETDRIVTAFIGVMDTGTGVLVERWSWLIDPGVPIPTEASDVHGITTERARAEGMDAQTGVFEISNTLKEIAERALPIVIMNAPFDITLLDREMLRHWPNLDPVWIGSWAMKFGDVWVDDDPINPDARFRCTWPIVFDPMVLDRAFDKWRPGKRTLTDLAAVYRVPVRADAHDAEADCIMAGQIAVKLMQHSRLDGLTLSQVHALLIPTKRKQTLELVDYWRHKKKYTDKAEREKFIASAKDAEANGHYWPLRPRPHTRGAQS